ncbi:hypothetical protein J2755_001809 [Methanohalophilus levihalophilus]|uniref:SRPBCC domain-containing protein n=1 Tax=Methanohalophilus levihalophilus TaxID=1431282 RepID=UPI001AE13918|nr:SRPBCC domain-containing protein [Methanohalophilus levihalophilus]MBP2030861.1 hypothetical protein [Methanohalophilus levihalophilus]
MREITTEIKIKASPEKVWEMLTDFSKFPEWNPFILEAQGEIEEGSKLLVRLARPNNKSMVFKPSVLKVEKGKEFRWLGHLFLPGFFDGEHIFEIIPLDSKSVKFIQREKFRGILVPLFWKSLGTNTKQGFNEMNAALKKRAEEVQN